MARSENTESFNEYVFEISISLKRKKDYYSSSSLAKVNVEREIPLATDFDAKHRLRELVTEEMNRSVGVVEAHIEFDNRVKQLTGGDVVEGSVS